MYSDKDTVTRLFTTAGFFFAENQNFILIWNNFK